jgi:putative transposase
MKSLLEVAGLSKQALWKSEKRAAVELDMERRIVSYISKVRTNHRQMGCRKMYFIDPEQHSVGRDTFERIGFKYGFKVKQKHNPMRTTWAQRVEVFDNLINGLTIDGINQLWQSDIFYIDVEHTPYYGICIEDVYSRRLLALHVSQSLRAEENILALKKAIKARAGYRLHQCIFHSDRGSQYISTKHKELLRSMGMRISMASVAQENAYVERINGIIKNEYLLQWELTKGNLKENAKKAMDFYNNERPHRNLGMLTPAAFEQSISHGTSKPSITIYNWNNHLNSRTKIINEEQIQNLNNLTR